MAKIMTSAATVRHQIEAALEKKIPSALTPAPKIRSAVHPTGIEALDELLKGGLPQGALSEFVGPECSGRTSIALSFLARMTREERVCAWIDVSNALDPVSAAAAGVDLRRLLWLRCGVTSAPATAPRASYKFELPERYLVAPAAKKGLHGGGFSRHPRHEVKGLSNAVGGLLQSEAMAPRCAEPQPRARSSQETVEPSPLQIQKAARRSSTPSKPWPRLEQALRSADLLLQAGGFSAIVLDMGSLAPEFVARVPLATWYRYRAAAERTQSSILLLTQYACAKSSAELVLQLQPAKPICDESTVFSGIQPCVEVMRQRYPRSASNVVPMRKPPQREEVATWQSRTVWAGRR
jgi:recombination protein RecA